MRNWGKVEDCWKRHAVERRVKEMYRDFGTKEMEHNTQLIFVD